MRYILRDKEVHSCWNCKAVCQPDDSDIMVAEQYDIITHDTRIYKYFKCPKCGQTIGVGKTMADMSAIKMEPLKPIPIEKKRWWQR